MDVTQEQLDEFLSLRSQAANSLANKTLKDNPNVTYGSLLSPKELELATHVFSPDIKSRAALIYDKEQLAKIENAIDWENRVAPYNRPPIEYDMYERHPQYMAQLDSYNADQDKRDAYNEKLRKWSEDNPGAYTRPPMPDDPNLQNLGAAPGEPWGLEKAKKIASLGFDPANELQFDTFLNGAGFRSKLAFAPRNMTIEDFKYLAEQHGLPDGEFRYINPSEPSLGLAYRPEGADEYQLLNTPFVTKEDTFNFIVQEFPALAGDIALTVWGSKKFTKSTGLDDKLYKKAGKVLGLSGLAAAGAAGGDFLRLTAGLQMGAHDRDFDEILRESGMIGAFAFGGTAVISTGAQLIPKVWKMMTGKDVPPSYYEKIDDLLQEARARETGDPSLTPGILYGDATSVKQINEQIEELAKRFELDLKNYNPTLGARSGTTEGADLETLFLKYADDVDLREAYEQIKLGNQEVIDRFVITLSEKIGPKTTTDVTAATLGTGIRDLAQKDIDAFNDQAYEMIDKVRLQVGAVGDDASLAGSTLLKQVDNPNASSGPLFERTQSRLKEIKTNYMLPYNQAWNDALNNPRYVNLTTGAGYTRKPAQDWLNLRKGETDKLFRSVESDEAVKLLFEQIPAGTRNTLNRLRGIGPKGKGGFESPNFSLKELNDSRVALNEFASTTNNVKAAQQARNLERGLEQQMNRLLREGASAESGIPLTRKAELENWINTNKYGDDLKIAWSNQKAAIELANSQAVRSILEQRPEKVAEYLLSTTAKGSKTNTVVTDLMTLLKRDGADEVLDIQNGVAAYIQREILQNPDRTPLQIARDFRKFRKENEATLRAIFGDDNFISRFNNKRSFDKVIDDLTKIEQNILKIEARVGLSSVDPDRRVANIVESILATGRTQKQSGILLDDIQYITNIVKGDPILEEQMAQVTKRYLLDEILKPRQGTGGAFELDDIALNKLLTEGFGPEDVVGPALTFDNFIVPLLGKDGPDFVKNIKILDDMVQRELGALPSEGVVRDLTRGEYGAGANIEGARMLQRLLIAPLTQTGRRITAISNSQANRSREFIGRMLLDPELFEQTMKMAQGVQNTQTFIRFLSAYGFVHARDLGNEMQYYDEIDKTQKTPETPVLPIPERVLEMTGGI